MAFWRRPKGRHEAGAAVRPAPEPSWATPPAPQPPPTVAGPRAELTFADGSSAALDPEAARELDQIAQILTGRTGVKR
jgi:hypothetical protein